MFKSISKIHYLTQDLPGVSHEALAKMACDGHMNWVQLRVKDQSYDDWLDTAWATKKVCIQYNTKLIINDNVNIAKEIQADGVHLGKNDLSPLMARAILGPGKIIGGTANTMEDIRILNEAGVDYIGVGPFRFTKTKKNLSPVLGLDGYRQIMGTCFKEDLVVPIIAIGGITLLDIAGLMEAGVDGVAVSSVINKNENPADAAMAVNKTMENWINDQARVKN